MDGEFYKDWSKRLIGPQTAAAYRGPEQGLAATQKAHNDKLYAQPSSTQPAAVGGLSNDPTAVATRRCLELGGEPVACMGKGFMGGLMGMVGVDTKAMLAPSRAGVVLVGNYRSRGTLPTVNFSSGNASIQNCGVLVADSRNYSIRKSPGAVKIVMENEPGQIVLDLQPDGGLIGPGLTTVKGQIITGCSTETKRLYVDGARSKLQRPVHHQ